MVVFVTGVSGFVGRFVLDALLRKLGPDDTVRVLVRGEYAPQDPRIEVVQGDLRRPGEWVHVLRDAAWVFHIAGEATFGNGREYVETNVSPVRAMVDALADSGSLRRIVYVSTIGAVDRSPADRLESPLSPRSPLWPTSDYGRSKREAEHIVQRSGLPYTIIRPGWVYGPDMRGTSHLSVIASTIVRHAWFASLSFPGRVPLIHVRDLASGLVRCLDRPESANNVYLAVTENRTLGDIARVLHERLHGVAPWQLPIGGLRRLVGRWHRWLPFRLNVLFSDYLAAVDPEFALTLAPEHPVRFEEGSQDVTSRSCGAGGWWIVTGANAGIGAAITKALRRRGVPVIAVDRCVDDLEETAGLRVVPADLSAVTGVDAVADAAAAVRVTGLVNNAGIGFRGDVSSRPLETEEATVAVNDLAPLRLTHRLLPHLRSTGATVVNVCSSVAYHPLPGMATYAASKAFLLSWSLALGEELRHTNLVVTFSPSGTNTRFQASGGVGGSRGPGLFDAQDVAREVLRAVDRRRRHRLMGWKARVLTVTLQFFPMTTRLSVLRVLFGRYR